LGRPGAGLVLAPTVVHFVSLPAPRGGRRPAWGGPAPAWALPPQVGRAAGAP